MLDVITELVEVEKGKGTRKVKVTLQDAQGAILDADLINPFHAAHRRKASRRLAERAGDPLAAERIEQAVLECADRVLGRDDAQLEQSAPQPLTDVTLVRPDLIVTRSLVALPVPEVAIADGAPQGRWRLYVSRDGGEQREAIEMASHLKSGEKTLWVHPFPSPPSPSTGAQANWTEASRQAFLDGTNPVEPLDVFVRLCEAFDAFLDVGQDEAADAQMGGVLPHPQIATLALWTMLTYVYPAWDAVPYLFVTGPAGSGKTRVFELLGRVVYRPLMSSNLSAPALFRTLHDRGGTLLLDEAERLIEGAPEVAEIRSILLAGYKRGGRASRLESVDGGSFKINEFAVFGPKAIACINPLPPALASRCIPIHMFRSPPESPRPKRRLDADPRRWRDLRDDLHRLALEKLGFLATLLCEASDVCPLPGRQYELWQPLMALARAVDQWVAGTAREGEAPSEPPSSAEPRAGTYLSLLLRHAKCTVESTSETSLPEEDFLLLWTVTELATRGKTPTCKEILEAARSSDAEAMRGMSTRRVSEILRRYGLKTIRANGRHVFADVIPQVKVIEARYGADLNSEGRQTVTVRGIYY